MRLRSLPNGFYKNGISLSLSVPIFARVLKRRICNGEPSLAPKTNVYMPRKINTLALPRRRETENKQSTSFRKRQVPIMGRKMYKVRWQKSFCNNLHSSDYSLRHESFDNSDKEYIISIVSQPEMIHAVT